MGVDVSRPRLSWIVESPEMGQGQTAYRILVASDKARLQKGNGDLWDSGKVASSETRDIVYSGKSLKDAQRVYWNVRVWDKHGLASLSPTATWTMHQLTPPKGAMWIGETDAQKARKGIGYHAAEANSLDETKWVQVDLGGEQSFYAVSLVPVRDHLGYPIFGFPVRYKVEVSDSPGFEHPTLLADHTAFDAAAPQSGPAVVQGGGQGRYVRVTATKLFKRNDGVGCFALAELQVFGPHQVNLALGKQVTALDSVERDGWTHEALTDGYGDQRDLVTLLLRREYKLDKPVSRATCFVTGLGQYEMHINGHKVGQNWITPAWTQYQKAVLVDSYDVTSMLKKGPNAVAIMLGNGTYAMEGDTRGSQQTNSFGSQKALAYIRIEHPDGSVEYWRTDKTWRMMPGPETYSGVFGGEDWDARLEQDGWDQPSFSGAKWRLANEVPAPKVAFHGITHAPPPMRVSEVRSPISVTALPDWRLVLDLGQNAPYVPEIKVRGAAGAVLRMWPAEQLKPDGHVDQQTMRAGKHASYTLRGGGVETWHPIFWYCGSRYWQIDAFDPQGTPIDPKSLLLDFKGLMVHGSERSVGTFECSNEDFNKIYSLIRWAMVSNFGDVISDCPHREKSGWLEQDHLVGPGLMYCFDMSAMFRKVVEDMHDAQQPNGMVPTMAPEYFIYEKGFRDSIEWGGAYLFLPRFMRDWYADKGTIGLHYPAMKRYIDYLGTCAKDDILSNGLGDWNGYGNDPRTPVGITDTAYYYLAVKALSEFAPTRGDSKKYGDLAERIRQHFNAAFLDKATGKVGTGSQSAQATALDLGLIDAADRGKVFEQLLKDVEEHEFAVSCGEVGHPSLLRVLAKGGRSDLIAKIHLQSDKPGYLYQIKKGNTTLTEAWDGSPISLNHFMMGHLMEWLYADLAGIKPDPSSPGFRSFIIQPQPVGQVTWAKATYDSIRGPILSSWKVEDGHFTLDLDVPANCTARVILPKRSSGPDRVTERTTGKTLSLKPSVDGAYHVPSGRFRFVR